MANSSAPAAAPVQNADELSKQLSIPVASPTNVLFQSDFDWAPGRTATATGFSDTPGLV